MSLIHRCCSHDLVPALEMQPTEGIGCLGASVHEVVTHCIHAPRESVLHLTDFLKVCSKMRLLALLTASLLAPTYVRNGTGSKRTLSPW